MYGDDGPDVEPQAVLNARPIPPRRLQNMGRRHIPVLVRVVWEHDGEQWLIASAVDWVGRDVLVWFDRELRLRTRGVWLDAADVKRP